VLQSGYSNLRLERYLFTLESFKDVQRVLKPTGVYAVYNFFRQGWIAARIRDQLRAAFNGTDPIGMTTSVLTPPRDEIALDTFSHHEFTLFFAGKPEVLEPIRAAFAKPERVWHFELPIRYWYPWKTGVDLDTKSRFSAIPPVDPPPAGAHKILDSQGKEEPPLWYGLRIAMVAETGGLRQATDDWPFLYSREEFRAQVEMHRSKIKQLFNQEPRVFRNTELIYNNDLAHFVSHMGYDGILTEGADQILGARSPNFPYKPPHAAKIKILLKNYRLSDDIAFRFSNREWEQWPVNAEKFAKWVCQINGHGNLCNLFMDYETFGEHQWESTGIFKFLEVLPDMVLQHGDWQFQTPSEVLDRYEPKADLSFKRLTSWADMDRDLSAWKTKYPGVIDQIRGVIPSHAKCVCFKYQLSPPVKYSEEFKLSYILCHRG
jgi:hypothetical protein